jgi:hypothetical protein
MQLPRSGIFPETAKAAVDANVLESIIDLLESANNLVREGVAGLLQSLAWHGSLVEAVLAIKPCVRLVSLLRCVSTFNS